MQGYFLSASTVEAFDEVEDSLCVPQYNKDGEERVVLFLKMASGHTFQPDLVKRIREAIRLGLSARHVPSLILETQGIPVRCVSPGPPRAWVSAACSCFFMGTTLPSNHLLPHDSISSSFCRMPYWG